MKKFNFLIILLLVSASVDFCRRPRAMNVPQQPAMVTVPQDYELEFERLKMEALNTVQMSYAD